jgi:hypothetical protein
MHMAIVFYDDKYTRHMVATALGSSPAALAEAVKMTWVEKDKALRADGPTDKRYVAVMFPVEVIELAGGLPDKIPARLSEPEAMHHPATDKKGHPVSDCPRRGCGRLAGAVVEEEGIGRVHKPGAGKFDHPVGECASRGCAR